MEPRVRVWVSGDADRAMPIVNGLIKHQIDARGGLDEVADLGEAGAIRWADVVVVTTRGRSISTAEAFIAGAAVGAQRPLVFLGPTTVQDFSLPGAMHTLLEPIAAEALAFQLETLGRKLANRRRSRGGPESPARPIRQKPTPIVGQGELRSDLEQRVYEQLLVTDGVSEIVLGSAAQSTEMVGGRQALTDFLVWLDGAQPFNPIPIEVKGSSSPRAFEQVFGFLDASRSVLGVLITDEEARPQAVERDGRIVVALPRQNMPELVELIRAARNALVHGQRTDG